MLLREFLIRTLLEGGNLELDNPSDPNTPHRADEIDLKVHQRNFIVPILDKLLHDINNAFKAQYKKPIWSEQLLASKQFLGGSSLHFFNTKGIDDQKFTQLKPKVGDIDTQVNKELEDEIKTFLTANYHKKIGDSTLLGYSAGNEQFNALFQFENPPMKIQIDFEFGRYSPETNTPDEWFRFSHSSDWADIEAGVKGVFHKYLYRALSGATSKQAYVAKMVGRGKARAIQVSDEPETINTASFAVASKQGGGVSQKYVPYIDPATNQPMVKDGLPVMQEVPSAERDYEQRLDKQFFTFFGRNPEPEDSKLQWSFVGTLDLINKYIDQARKPKILEDFLDICFEPGSQMITRDDPKRDAQTKFAAIDLMIEKLGLKSMRPKAIQMAKAYEDEFNEVEAYKKAHPEERQPRAALKKMKAAQGLTEAEDPAVKAQLRKGMPHLRDLKPADFLDLIDEMQAEGGRFKLQNIPLNVKVDGFGGRFGKNAEGQPFMATSRTEPRYKAGFVDYHKQKGTTDPEILGRAENFDKLFNEMMAAIKVVDRALGPDFLVNRQVTCEVLFLPFATQTEEGKLKFVGIEYDQLPAGVDLVIVPYRIVEASTGEDMPDGDRVVQKIAELGQSGSVSFMSNRLVQEEGLDVTEIINPLENIEELKNIISGVAGKRDRASLALRREVEEKLKPVQIALEKAIDEDPNIVGKDMLGQDYEGIVINSRLGPIKVTSQRQKDIITAKNAARAAARSEQGRENANKTAVVAIGSFAGHKGHQELWDYTVKKAAELKGDPYLFIGNAEGKDDPIPPAVKVETWHRLYPDYADNISTVMAGGSLLQKIKHELINPLPGKPPRYDNIVIMVGEDRADMPIANALMKAVNKFQGYEHVKVSLQVTPRGTGMSFTKLRNVLKDPNATAEHQLQVWEQGFDVQRLGIDWIKHLMDITRKGMGIQQPAPTPVAEVRLFNSLIRPTLYETARMSSAVKLQRAWDQQRSKSDASRKRGEEVMAQARSDWEKKQAAEKNKEQGVEEGFDQPYPISWTKGDHGDLDALAKLPDGSPLSIMFNQQQDNDGDEITQVQFYRNNSQEVTGEGDAQRVFSTVLNAIQQYIKKRKPLRLTFAASKQIDPTVMYGPDDPQPNPESRAKLYDRLVQRYSKAWGYRAFRADNGDLVMYELSRMKPRVAEAPDSNFVGFMNKTLGQKTDAPANKSSMPNFMKDAPVAGLDSMGYRAALNFGMKTLNKLTPTQKTKLSIKGEDGVVNWLASQAKKQGLLITDEDDEDTQGKFMQEDLEEVQDFLPEVFKDPAIKSWAFVLTDGEPLPKAPVAGPFSVSINPGLPNDDGYANSDWKTLDTLENLPDAIQLAQGLAQKNPKQFVGIWAANGKSAGFYWPGQGWRGLKEGVAEGLTTEKQILTRIRQIMYDRKLSGTESNAGELLRLKQQLKDLRSQQGVAEAAYNPDTFVGKKGTYKGYGITQEGPYQWGISSSARKFPTLNAAKRHIDKNLVAEGAGNSLPSILYHGGKDPISQFDIPPHGVYFSPHEEWARNYGDTITQVKVKADKVYKIDYSHKIDDAIMDALFDRDYLTVSKFIKMLKAKGYQAMQSVSDSEMVVVFPGTQIEIVEQQGVAEGLEPQVGDAVYYGKRLVGWFKGYSEHGKIITEPNYEEMGDEYANRDVYWDPQAKITIRPEQGMAEGAPIVVMPRSDRVGTKKPAQPYRNQGDIVPPTKPPSTEKRGVKGRPGQRPMPDHSVEEEMLPKSVFAGTKVGQKVGAAGQWKNTGPSKNRPARAGDLVGGAAQESAGSGVIASKKQAKDPRYSMSLTKDVRPGQIAKNLKAFSLEEDVETAMATAISKLIESQLK